VLNEPAEPVGLGFRVAPPDICGDLKCPRNTSDAASGQSNQHGNIEYGVHRLITLGWTLYNQNGYERNDCQASVVPMQYPTTPKQNALHEEGVSVRISLWLTR
jgi:hypothetical protein